MTKLHVLVCTVVHHPEDARILHRQIRAMLDAGWKVTYAAPFTAYGVAPWPELEMVDVPRASGRQRLGAVRAAREVLRRFRATVDVVILHDPELLLALPGSKLECAVIWDVHEDTAAALVAKPWLPRPLRPVVFGAVRFVEYVAERKTRLTLAETSYRRRFRKVHPIVQNTTYVPAEVRRSEGDRVVYVGHLTAARGVDTMVEAAKLLRGSGISVEIVGHADDHAKKVLREADAEGILRWHGFLPNSAAMELLDGALCGWSLLRDLPNYRHSMPTKVLEYMAHGVPVVTTPLPSAVTLVNVHKSGVVVPFDDASAVAEAVRSLRADEEARIQMGTRGHQAARTHYHWPDTAQEFLTRLERWAKHSRSHSCLTLGTD